MKLKKSFKDINRMRLMKLYKILDLEKWNKIIIKILT